MVKGFFLASWAGRMMGRVGPDGQTWGVKFLFVRVEGSKHQVRHNTDVWALGTAWLCMGVEGGGTANRVRVGGGCSDCAPFNIHTQED